MTHVYSRPKLFEDADEKLARCSDGYPVSIAIIDIDDFKKVNDTYGHENGDKVLECLGSILKSYQSSMLSIGRYGGEEFVFVFESGTPTEHHEILDTIRIKFWNSKYDFMSEHVSFSAGITSARETRPFDELLDIADHALYRSKHRGKNCISRE